MGEADQAVVDGVLDTEFNAAYPGSVMLEWQGVFEDATVICSGTLVSPTWVITAAHCMAGADEYSVVDRSERDWTVYVSPHGKSPPPSDQPAFVYDYDAGPGFPGVRGVPGSHKYGRVYRHTFARSGRVPYFNPVTEVWNRDRDLDIALVKLDERVPHPVGVHARLPTSPRECSDVHTSDPENDYFAGRLSGYSTRGFNEENFDCQTGWANARRRRGPGFIDWHRELGPDASIAFHNFFSLPHDVCNGGMAGIGSSGDSGGSLYKYQSGYPNPLLCGVISGDGPDNTDIVDGLVYSHYAAAATDDAVNMDWMAAVHILDVDRFVDYGYEPRGVDDDGDEDGIADLWDNCPEVENEYQLYQNNDPDLDGVGNDCETCVGSDASDYLTDSNWEVEWITGASQVRDWCDPMPVPVQTLDSSYGTLPNNAIPTPAAGYETELRNWIDIDSLGTPATAGLNATIGLRFCDCKNAPGVTTDPGGRALCRNQATNPCTYSGTAYDSSTSVWKKITTQRNLGTETWNIPQLGRAWTVPVDGGFATSWDFRQLGTAVTTTPTSQKVKGILWATIRSLSGSVPQLSPSAIQDRAATLGTGDAYWQHVPLHTPAWKTTDDAVFCPNCPQRAQNPYFEVSNPQWREPIEARSVPFGAPDASTVQHYEQVAAGTVRHVTASEPLAILAKTIRPGHPKVRSVGIEGQAVTRVLVGERLDQLPSRTAYAASGGPTSGSGRGAAFSASKQRLYLVGGTQATGAPLNDGWFLDLPTSAWRHFTFPAGEGVGAVAATTYRWQDETVYFLDKSGTTLRLRRWNAQRVLSAGVVQTLATFPSSWSAFSKLELLNTPAGNLLVVAWAGTGTEKTRVGHFTVSPARVVNLVGLVKSTSITLAGLPVVGETGYTMVRNGSPTAPSKPYGTSVTFASMPAAGATDAPTLLPH